MTFKSPHRRFLKNKRKNNSNFQKALKTTDSPRAPESCRRYSPSLRGQQVYTASEGKFLNF